uniref:Uncharacterized protein n=1 Tax=Anguilla anguilla TaxID=7936 RepID=A0A0E9SA13_ANGAN
MRLNDLPISRFSDCNNINELKNNEREKLLLTSQAYQNAVFGFNGENEK